MIHGQVGGLIEEARKDTEQKVKVELRQLREWLVAMDRQVTQLLAELGAVTPTKPPAEHLDMDTVQTSISRVEHQWDKELKMLKQELKQTILAHNHNAELMKHHQDTLVALRARVDAVCGGAKVRQQLGVFESRLQGQQRPRRLESITERIGVLEKRLVAAASDAAYRYAAQTPGSTYPYMAGYPVTRSSAAEAGSVIQQGPACPGSPTHGYSVAPAQVERAAYKCPTDEELQARIKRLGSGQDPL